MSKFQRRAVTGRSPAKGDRGTFANRRLTGARLADDRPLPRRLFFWQAKEAFGSSLLEPVAASPARGARPFGPSHGKAQAGDRLQAQGPRRGQRAKRASGPVNTQSQKIFDFLKRPVITEKATKLIEQKQYTFDVDSQLTKKQIKKIFEYYYGIHIKSIKTHRIGKKNISKPIKRVILCFSKNQESLDIFKNFVQKDLLTKEKD